MSTQIPDRPIGLQGASLWVNRILSPVMVILLCVALVYEWIPPRRAHQGETLLRSLLYGVFGIVYVWKSIHAWKPNRQSITQDSES